MDFLHNLETFTSNLVRRWAKVVHTFEKKILCLLVASKLKYLKVYQYRDAQNGSLNFSQYTLCIIALPWNL
jgi:hypothetical protein